MKFSNKIYLNEDGMEVYDSLSDAYDNKWVPEDEKALIAEYTLTSIKSVTTKVLIDDLSEDETRLLVADDEFPTPTA